VFVVQPFCDRRLDQPGAVLGVSSVEGLQKPAGKFQEYEFNYGHAICEMLFRGPRG
jgi:hypothetical protein